MNAASATRLIPTVRPAVIYWLIVVCVCITLMVSLGGITRLTGSGLSITDWKPIMGAIPPLHHDEWMEAFGKYREIPQYKILNQGMTLSQFKEIFFWEYFHRLVGRLLGVVVLVPGIFFVVRKWIDRRLAWRVGLGFILGGLQGAIGWFMVMSGLSERTSVSHFRLALHLCMALFILAYFVWIVRDLVTGKAPLPESERAGARRLIRPFRHVRTVILIQIVWGAFVAGLKAGFGFNTFPKMNDEWIPSNFWLLDPAWINPLQNPAAVQWVHRTLGWLVLIASALLVRRALKSLQGETRRYTLILSGLIALQFLLGVATLVLVVPIPLAVLHQFGAALIVIALTVLSHSLRRA